MTPRDFGGEGRGGALRAIMKLALSEVWHALLCGGVAGYIMGREADLPYGVRWFVIGAGLYLITTRRERA
jgi:hypothetical protein